MKYLSFCNGEWCPPLTYSMHVCVRWANILLSHVFLFSSYSPTIICSSQSQVEWVQSAYFFQCLSLLSI